MIRLLFFLVFFSSFLCHNIFSAENVEDIVVVRVNNKIYTKSEIEERYDFVVRSNKIKVSNAKEKKLLLDSIIEKIIDEELIIQNSQKLKFEVSESDIDEAIKYLSKKRNQSELQFKNFFKKNNLSFETYKNQLVSEILWSRIIEEIIKPRTKVSDLEIKEFLEQKKINSNVKKFLLAEIVVNNSQNSKEFSKKLLQELNQGADFKSMFHQFSANSSFKSDGEIGWLSEQEMNPKIFESIAKLEKNQYSQPVLLSDGYHIFKLLNIKTESNLNEDDRKIAHNFIINKKMEASGKGYLMDLRKKSFIEIKNFNKN